jgi:hypothetical protein
MSLLKPFIASNQNGTDNTSSKILQQITDILFQDIKTPNSMRNHIFFELDINISVWKMHLRPQTNRKIQSVTIQHCSCLRHYDWLVKLSGSSINGPFEMSPKLTSLYWHSWPGLLPPVDFPSKSIPFDFCVDPGKRYRKQISKNLQICLDQNQKNYTNLMVSRNQ